jgi:hypothetical protein
MLSLFIRNLVFTVVVPGLGGAWVPAWLLTRDGGAAVPVAWEAAPVIAAGAALYLWCAWNFAAVGRGTPGPWDAPRRVVADGPYRWVRNPIYLAPLLVVLGEAGLFGSLRLLAYAATASAKNSSVSAGSLSRSRVKTITGTTHSPDRRPARRRFAGRSLFPRYAPRVHRRPAAPQRSAEPEPVPARY